MFEQDEAVREALFAAAEQINHSGKGSADYRAGWRDALEAVAKDPALATPPPVPAAPRIVENAYPSQVIGGKPRFDAHVEAVPAALPLDVEPCGHVYSNGLRCGGHRRGSADRGLLEAIEDVLASDSSDPDDHLHWAHLRRIVRERRAHLGPDKDGADVDEEAGK